MVSEVNKGGSQVLSVRVHPYLVSIVDRLAQRAGQSRSEWIERSVIRVLLGRRRQLTREEVNWLLHSVEFWKNEDSYSEPMIRRGVSLNPKNMIEEG